MKTGSSIKTKKSVTKKYRRGGWYKQGLFKSHKTPKEVEYRSGWELTVCQLLHDDPDVVMFEYESIGIPYVKNPRSGKVRKYFPDFIVQYGDGRKVIVEVKRDDRVETKIVKIKAEACIAWANRLGIGYEIWSSKEIKQKTAELKAKLSGQNQVSGTKEQSKVVNPSSTTSDLISVPQSSVSASLTTKEGLRSLMESSSERLENILFGKKLT